MTHWIHDGFWLQQDYLWFLAGLAWLAAGSWWWQQRRERALPAWIPWSASAGLAIACTQILILISPTVQLLPNQLPSLHGDLALGAAIAFQAVGWWWTGLKQVRGRGVLAGLIAGLAVLAAFWRYERPQEGTILILFLLGGAWTWWNFTIAREHRLWRGAMLATALAPLLDTTGPIAHATVDVQRWYDLSPLGPWAAIAQLVAAGLVLAAMQRQHRATRAHAEFWRSERFFWGWMSVWLAGGVLLAIAVGNQGRRSFEQSALGRVRAAAALMPMDNIAALLDERFQLEEISWYQFSYGARLPVAQSSHAATCGARATADIRRIGDINPDVQCVTVSTLRDGWLVAAAIGESNRTNFGTVTLLRRAEPADLAAWETRRAEILGPVMLSPGETVFARAPLQDASGRMLGWLVFDFNVSQWIAAQAQARTLAYLIIALGLVIGRQFVVQRVRARERDRAQAEAESAMQASRLKTSFLANVSHELRTPLQSIQGYTELLLPSVQPRDRDRLIAVREHADLMGRLVNDLIDLSAAESGRFHLVERAVAVVDLVIQAAETLRHRADTKGLAFSVEAAPEIPSWVFADPQRIRQVVLNLVGNAIKYTDRGRVDVALALVGRDRDSVELELRVRDTGPGIPAETQAAIFEPFRRLDHTAEREGTGLGLAIVAAVTKAMRGSVRVESDGRSGSTFLVRWRLRLAPHAGPAPATQVPLQGKKILVADDNALVRDLFVAYLTECGAICATAADGAEAVRRLRVEDFEAVVLDLAMPKLDGLSAVRQLRRELPEKRWRIVGVSAHAGGAEHDEALAAGMDAFLVKPVALPELARALAPTIGWIPPTRSFERLRTHFEQRFRGDAPEQCAAVTRALASGRWPEIHAAIHYLKNSADVVGDPDLARACARLEAAARAQDRAAGDEAWRHCRVALARWLTEPAAN